MSTEEGSKISMKITEASFAIVEYTCCMDRHGFWGNLVDIGYVTKSIITYMYQCAFVFCLKINCRTQNRGVSPPVWESFDGSKLSMKNKSNCVLNIKEHII